MEEKWRGEWSTKYQDCVVFVGSQEDLSALNDSGPRSWRQRIRIRSVCLLISPETPEKPQANSAFLSEHIFSWYPVPQAKHCSEKCFDMQQPSVRNTKIYR